MAAANEKHRAFATLDGLRGIAALMILTRHGPAFFTSAARPMGPFFESYLAVDFFFMLSGFVLSHAYADKLRAGLGCGRFMIIRFIRLYPLYFLALAILVAFDFRGVMQGDPQGGAVNTLFALLMLPSPASSDSLFPLNPPAWSLFFELIANLLFGAIVFRLSTKGLAALVAAAGGALLIAVLCGLFGFDHSWTGAMDSGFGWQSWGAGVPRVMFGFFLGVLLHRVFVALKARPRVPALLCPLALFAVLAAHPQPQYKIAFDLAAVLVVFPLILFLGAMSAPNRPVGRIFAVLGIASYAVYVLQYPVYNLLWKVITALSAGHPGEFTLVSAVMFSLAMVVLAMLADRFYDAPVRRLLTSALVKSGRRDIAAQDAMPRQIG
jgi:peptidoglycan/LPS O-acetylase OafA/YrhL